MRSANRVDDRVGSHSTSPTLKSPMYRAPLILASAIPFFSLSAPAQPPLPKPLIHLEFSRDFKNEGTLGGEGTAITYAPNQTPAFGPGFRGTCLSLLSSSRGGGSDQTRAGGAVRLKTPGLSKLEKITLCLWFQPVGPNAPARLLYLGHSWDVSVTGRHLGFKIKHENQDVPFSPVQQKRFSIDEHGWNFLAITIDRAKRETLFYHARPGETPSLVATWNDMPRPDSGEADLEIGNLDGIRPFRGLIDSVAIYESILNPDQITALTRQPRPPQPDIWGESTQPSAPALLTHSDVCLSSRSKHPNSVETLGQFKANRLLWTYAVDPEFATACRAAGAATYQGTINSLPGTTESDAHVLDLDSHPVVAPWMRAFSKKNPVYWGCNNRPRFLEISVERAKQALDAGADSLQFDDWSLVVSASGWAGGCFCPDCIAGFRRDLKEHASSQDLTRLGIQDVDNFDYRTFLKQHLGIPDAATYSARKHSLPTTPFFEAFQRRSVRSFFRELRRQVNAIAGREVPLSINATLLNPSQRENFIVDLVDFVQGETLFFQPAEIALAARTAEGLGKWHVFVPESLDTHEVRAGIATAYAMGQLPLVPWDMYMGSDEHSIQPRGWGTVAEYGDLFHFAREHASLLDQHETVARVALVLDTDHLDRAVAIATCQQLLDAQVPFAIVPVGYSFVDLPLTTKRLAPFDTIIALGNPQTWEPRDQTALRDAARDHAVIDANQLTPELCSGLSWFETWGPRNMLVLPRRNHQRPEHTLVCHVLNPGSHAEPMKWISFVLKRNAPVPGHLTKILWHTPGSTPKHLEPEPTEDGTRILLPEAPAWGIAELQFAPEPAAPSAKTSHD